MSDKPSRFYKGYNKGASSSKPHAPWDGSTFAVEWESNKSEQQSEYNKTYYAKPGNCKAKPIRPESDNRSWMIGNVNEKMDADTTYKGIFMPHDQQQKAVAHRPHENGVIYECAPCNSMTTTHDKEYTVGNFPGKRTIPRSDYQSDKAPITTMKKDFDYKKVDEKVQPYRPPVGLADTFGSDKVEFRSSNQEDYVPTDMKKIEPVKNCKPIREYTKPNEPMTCVTTTHSQFTGQPSKPAKSCKPAPTNNGINC